MHKTYIHGKADRYIKATREFANRKYGHSRTQSQPTKIWSKQAHCQEKVGHIMTQSQHKVWSHQDTMPNNKYMSQQYTQSMKI